jgi:prepilin-type N-terminal cleavage/methylation domain-containing protein
MSSPRRLFRPARSLSGKGGFTLVELLVVIAIIAILAGVAFGPITAGIEKANESAGMQTSRTICLAMFQYQVDNSSFPGGKNSEAVAAALVQGNYITDPSIFAKNKTVAYTGTTANIGTMPSTAICWDFIVESAQDSSGNYLGLQTSDPDSMPAIFSTGQTIVIPSQGGTSSTPITMGTTNPFGNNGMAVCFKSNSAAFLKADNVGGSYQIATKASNYLFNPSFSCTPGSFAQIKP